MKKRRLKEPYEFMWEDEEGMLHICEYLSCEDGCECEKMMMSKQFLIDFFKKYGSTGTNQWENKNIS